jgi:ketosteroid isomerase-like protein
MSEENVDLVRRAFAAWESGDPAAILQYLHEDVVSRRVAPLIDPQTYHGPNGVTELIAGWLKPYDHFSSRADEFIDAGDSVVVRVPQEARLAGSEQLLTGTFWFLLGFQGEKVIRLEIYGERRQALEAAGVKE